MFKNSTMSIDRKTDYKQNRLNRVRCLIKTLVVISKFFEMPQIQ